ncbi:hypothetical protein SAMN02910357_00077 [Succinivibrio dextrinosolvens]|uniref:hypothetical protein n=1 Tax=Succinivibrio dextrinosolvens TaxID=83771 RepID=UPI0008E76882|nr:hypothetical protein [Succinivibrio dextrinosolvens]SFS31892.1 hypothetical protein SAMN02910357_00077 [Succinivibrio dextrinosolvens]
MSKLISLITLIAFLNLQACSSQPKIQRTPEEAELLKPAVVETDTELAEQTEKKEEPQKEMTFGEYVYVGVMSTVVAGALIAGEVFKNTH